MIIIDIYTDGSHLDKLNNGRLGCGGVMVDRTTGKLLDEFGEELTPDFMKKEFGADKCSNPTAEMVGLLYALRKFDIPKDVDLVVCYADFVGVKSWMQGDWQCKEPYLKKVKEAIDREINKKGLRGKMQYEWVKAHQTKAAIKTDRNAYWNDKVDSLAKTGKRL